MGHTRITGFLVVLATCAFILGYGRYVRVKKAEAKQLHIFAWSNYLPGSIIKDFENATQSQIVLSYFSSNEEMLAKIQAGSSDYDLIMPSDYMVSRMKKLGLLHPLDPTKLSHLQGIDAFFSTLSYDPGFSVSVPFSFGTTGIIVDRSKVKQITQPVSWSLLFDSPTTERTSLLDDMREVFSAFMIYKGTTLESATDLQIKTARKDLLTVKNRVLMFTTEVLPLLHRGELTIAHGYSTDAAQAHELNSKIEYYIPIEGATLWIDTLAIMNTSKKKELAHQFINFLLEPQNMASLATQNLVAITNSNARSLLSAQRRDHPILYPKQSDLNRLRIFEDIPNKLPQLDRWWTELKVSE